jgi:4-amino-4-deoxy-L-arabinose transferase-like glycosyltransferase
VARDVFEGIPHLEDEMALLWEADVMAEGRIDLPSPPSPTSFLVPFVVDHDGRRFGKYPPGWPAALSLGARLDAEWIVNPLLAGLGVWLIYRLGSRVAGPWIGLLAAALSAVSPMFWMLSGSLMGHSFGLVLAAAFWLAWLDLFARPPVEGRRPPTALVAAVGGMSLGLLALTRPLTAVGIAFPAAFWGLWILLRGDAAARRRLLLVVLIGAGLCAILLLWQAALTGDPWLNPYTLWWDYDRVGFGPGIGRTASGHNLHWAWINTRFSLIAGLSDLFGWPNLSWIFLPFGLLALRRNREGLLLFATFPALVLVYSAYWIGSWLLGPRYYYESLPGLAIVSAAGVAWLGGWLRRRAGRFGRIRAISVAAMLFLLVSLDLRFYIPLRVGNLRGLYGISRERMLPLQRAGLEHDLVIVHPAEIWTEYGSLLTLVPPFAETNFLLAYTRGPGADESLAELYPGYRVIHYYPDDPEHFYESSR